MGREILTIQLGQCGNAIGTSFWQSLNNDHYLNNQGIFQKNQTNSLYEEFKRLEKINVFYKETVNDNQYIPRTILIDNDPTTLDLIKASSIASIFRVDNFVFGSNGLNNNWATGHYGDGTELIEEAFDIIRQEVESCESILGFKFIHSITGGTGAGIGTHLLYKIRDNFPDRITNGIYIVPNPDPSGSNNIINRNTSIDPYNCILSLHQILENSDVSIMIENKSVYNIAKNILKQNNPTYDDLNWIISLFLNGFTSSSRFSGKMNSDLRKMSVNLIPFPRLHFFVTSQVPLYLRTYNIMHNINNLNDLNTAMFNRNNWNCLNGNTSINDNDKQEYLAVSCTYRGNNIKTQEMDQNISNLQHAMNDNFVPFIPKNFKTGIVTIKNGEIKNNDNFVSSTFVANTCLIRGMFSEMRTRFNSIWKTKKGFEQYKQEGMDPMEFQEAAANIRDLITEYQDKQEFQMQPWDDDFDDDDDDDDYDNFDNDDDIDDTDDDDSEF